MTTAVLANHAIRRLREFDCMSSRHQLLPPAIPLCSFTRTINGQSVIPLAMVCPLDFPFAHLPLRPISSSDVTARCGTLFLVIVDMLGDKQFGHTLMRAPGLASAAAAMFDLDKRLVTDWYAGGFMYMFNRVWGVMARSSHANRLFTTDPGPS